MKRLNFLFLLGLMCTGFAFGQKKTVAVIPAEGASVSQDIRIGVTNGLQEGVFNSGEYTLLARGKAFEKALSEMNFQQSGAVSDDQLTAFGHAAGAEFVCYATLSKYSENSYRISYKMINVASGEIVNMGSETVRNGTDGLLTATDDIAKKLFGSNSETSAVSDNTEKQSYNVSNMVSHSSQSSSDGELSFYFAANNEFVKDEDGAIQISLSLLGYGSEQIGSGTLKGGFSIKIQNAHPGLKILMIKKIRMDKTQVNAASFRINTKDKTNFEFTLLREEKKDVTYYSFILK